MFVTNVTKAWVLITRDHLISHFRNILFPYYFLRHVGSQSSRRQLVAVNKQRLVAVRSYYGGWHAR